LLHWIRDAAAAPPVNNNNGDAPGWACTKPRSQCQFSQSPVRCRGLRWARRPRGRPQVWACSGVFSRPWHASRTVPRRPARRGIVFEVQSFEAPGCCAAKKENPEP